MTEQELCGRMLENFKTGDEQFPQIFVIDDLLEAVLVAAIASLVGWLVKRCLNANFDAEKLDRLVKWSCRVACRSETARQRKVDAEWLYTQYGERLAAAVAKTRHGLKYREMRALQQSYPQRGFADTPEFPEDA